MTISPGITLDSEFKVGDRVYIDGSCKDYPGYGEALHGVVKGKSGTRYAVEFEKLMIGHDCTPEGYYGGIIRPLCSGRKGWWVYPRDLKRYSAFHDKVLAYVTKELGT